MGFAGLGSLTIYISNTLLYILWLPQSCILWLPQLPHGKGTSDHPVLTPPYQSQMVDLYLCNVYFVRQTACNSMEAYSTHVCNHSQHAALTIECLRKRMCVECLLRPYTCHYGPQASQDLQSSYTNWIRTSSMTQSDVPHCNLRKGFCTQM